MCDGPWMWLGCVMDHVCGWDGSSMWLGTEKDTGGG